MCRYFGELLLRLVSTAEDKVYLNFETLIGIYKIRNRAKREQSKTRIKFKKRTKIRKKQEHMFNVVIINIGKQSKIEKAHNKAVKRTKACVVFIALVN